MKTLREFLWEECLQHLDLGENGPYDEMTDLENDLLKAVYNWLESKRNFPLSRTPDSIQISELQDELKGAKPT